MRAVIFDNRIHIDEFNDEIIITKKLFEFLTAKKINFVKRSYCEVYLTREKGHIYIHDLIPLTSEQYVDFYGVPYVVFYTESKTPIYTSLTGHVYNKIKAFEFNGKTYHRLK